MFEHCKNLLHYLATKLLNFLHYENIVRFCRAVCKKYLKELIIFLNIIIPVSWRYDLSVLVILFPFLLAAPTIGDIDMMPFSLATLFICYFHFLWSYLWFSAVNERNRNRSCNLHHELDYPQAAPVFGM